MFLTFFHVFSEIPWFFLSLRTIEAVAGLTLASFAISLNVIFFFILYQNLLVKINNLLEISLNSMQIN